MGRTSSPAPMREERRANVREWARTTWHEPCEAIFFRCKRVRLEQFDGRVGTSATSLRRTIRRVVSPFARALRGRFRRTVTRVHGAKTPSQPDRPGVLFMTGSTRNPGATSLVDAVERAPRNLWIVFSRARLAVLVADRRDKPARVVWWTDTSASVRLHRAAHNAIEINWPDGSRAFFRPTFEERAFVARFVNAAWDASQP